MTNLPAGWITCKVGELFNSFSGGTPNKGTLSYWKGDIPWVSSGDVKADRIQRGSEFITKDGLDNSSAKLCRPGSIIVVVRSGILKHTLPVALVSNELSINQDIKCFDSGNDDLNHWLLLSLRNSAREILSLNREGTTVQSVKYETLKEHELVVPPRNEQLRIVAKLEKLLSRVNAAQERLATIPLILKRFRQSVLAAACSGRLTADWRERNAQVEPASRMLSRLGVSSTEADVTSLPETWVWCEFGAYVENYDGGRIPIESKEREKRQGGYPYYGASGVIDSIDGFTHEGKFLLIGEDGANLLARSKPIAFLAQGRIWVNNHAHVVRCKDGLPNEYLCHYINSIDLQQYVTGSAQPKLTQSNMNRIRVPVAPISEQQEIIRRVEALFKTADALEARYLKAKAHVDKLTQSILAKAFRGELVPQDPNDEPAAVLLERIRKQRNGSAEKKRPAK
jgi:type I restriction enzyme S subunit